MIIYKITNKINGHFYIGKTSKSKEERIRRHFYNASYGSETHLYRAIRKYGEQNFFIEELENSIDKSNINEKEIYYISKLNPKYNMTSGGDGGSTCNSPNFTKAMKEYHRKKPKEEYATYGFLGKKHTDDGKKSISKANSYSVKIDDVVYGSIKEAKDILGVSEKTVRYRIDSPNYPNWFRLREKRIYPNQGSSAM